MALRYAAFLLLLFCTAYSHPFRGTAGHSPFVQDPEEEWERMTTAVGNEVDDTLSPQNKLFMGASTDGSSTSQAKLVPKYLVASFSEDKVKDFKPGMGAGPLPNWASKMLLKTATTSPTVAASPQLVEILCHVDRLYIRVRKEIFKTNNAHKYLKFGTCPVNHGTTEHYYFLYLLTADCGFEKESTADYRYVGSVLTYNPTTPVLREMPFEIPMQCKYPRLFHSYKVGFHPKLQGGEIFKSLESHKSPHSKTMFTLTFQNALGFDVTGAQSYNLGETMYFQAKQLSNSGNRIYINKCFMTASRNPTSSPKYMVIDNYGCMVDGMMTDQSVFISGTSKLVLRFSVVAAIFKNMASASSSSQQLYMHCDLSMGPLVPTESSKTCNYDLATKTWKELYGSDSVCTCCDSTCHSIKSKAKNMISSKSWTIDLSNKDGHDKDDKFYPRMKLSDADVLVDNSNKAEHTDFLQNWGKD
ncbi:zona pellucida sperm-binding protein 3 [Etheostoma cragini]|uniref:zona pellucida sperm-binding protein 3 n=1 Tax=Etheostoma cragini TaxID=417921 RepID=UPI00155E17E5|nr:zona pellucida sperm-binding protein 3 [Etheostoma cragini]